MEKILYLKQKTNKKNDVLVQLFVVLIHYYTVKIKSALNIQSNLRNPLNMIRLLKFPIGYSKNLK